MKNIIFIGALIALFSCKKIGLVDTGIQQLANKAPTSGTLFFYTNAAPTVNEIIQGIRTTCNVIKFKGSDKKSLSITMYMDNGYWVQTGYHTYNNYTLPFTQVWKDGSQAGVDVILINQPILKFGNRQSFSIYNVSGTTKWRTTIDGLDCLELELFTQSGDRAELYTEEGPVDNPSRFPNINFYPALEKYQNGTWQNVQSGIVTQSSWGIQANGFNNINIGSSYNNIPYGTILW